MRPSVTVCIGVYNGAQRLPFALESVRAQTFTDYEILVVDDGSQDDSAAVAERYGARVIRQPNAGIGAAREQLMLHAETDLIAIMDDDDAWLPQKLEIQIPAHREAGAVLSHTAGWWVAPDGSRTFRELRPTDAKCSYDHVLPENRIMASSVVFDRQLMLDAGNFTGAVRYTNDWYGWLLLARKGPYLFVDEPLLLYTRREGQITSLGLRFFDGQRQMLEHHILPRWEDLLSAAPPERKGDYLKGFHRYLGQLNETVGRYQWVERGDRVLAMRHALRAIRFDPTRRSAYTMLARLLVLPRSVRT